MNDKFDKFQGISTSGNIGLGLSPVDFAAGYTYSWKAN